MCIIFLLKKLISKIINYLKWLFCSCDNGGSGSGSHTNKYKKLKLIRKLNDNIIGKGFHRSGWFSVMKYLSIFDSEDGILFDDFIEQNFCYNSNPTIYNEPWVGIFHHPPLPPFFSNEKEKMHNYLNTTAFKESSKNLKLAVVLTEYQKLYLEKYLTCPILVLKHPCENNFEKWSFEKWSNDKKLTQIGFYLRNTQLSFQIPDIENVKKIRLWSNSKWISDYDNTVSNFWKATGKRKNIGTVKNVSFQTPSSYDKIISSSVVITETFDLAASNVVLDCIVRNTPLIINRSPAAEEYLGKDYPLYFESPLEVPSLLDKVKEASEYLANLDKTDISMEKFTSNLIKKINEI